MYLLRPLVHNHRTFDSRNGMIYKGSMIVNQKFLNEVTRLVIVKCIILIFPKRNSFH